MSLRIVQLTDLHLLSPGELLMGLDVQQRFQAVLDAAKQLRPDAYFLTGDFCAHEPVYAVYDRLKPQLDRLEVPYYLAAGNHDDPQMMRSVFGLEGAQGAPVYYRVDLRDQPFLVLDTSPGELDREQVDWLERQLQAAPRATLVMHHPPVPLGVKFMDAKYPLRTSDRLYEVLTSDGIRRRVLCGHYHSVRMVSHRNLDIYLCPPTSFFINPQAGEFELRERGPGYQLLEWQDGGDFRCSSLVVSG